MCLGSAFEEQFQGHGTLSDNVMRPGAHRVPPPYKARKIIQPKGKQAFHHEADLNDIRLLAKRATRGLFHVLEAFFNPRALLGMMDENSGNGLGQNRMGCLQIDPSLPAPM
jgi:hypothetical protein